MRTRYRVLDAMTLKPISVHPDATLQEAAVLLRKHNVGSLIVKENNDLKGIVTDWDFTRKAVAEGADVKRVLVRDIMVSDLITIHPDMDIFEALRLMSETNIRHMPVMKDGKMVGFLTMKDILKIQPELFDIIIDKYELREEDRKPIFEELNLRKL